MTKLHHSKYSQNRYLISNCLNLFHNTGWLKSSQSGLTIPSHILIACICRCECGSGVEGARSRIIHSKDNGSEPGAACIDSVHLLILFITFHVLKNVKKKIAAQQNIESIRPYSSDSTIILLTTCMPITGDLGGVTVQPRVI